MEVITQNTDHLASPDALYGASDLLPTETENQKLETNDYIIEQENSNENQADKENLSESALTQKSERMLQDLTNNSSVNNTQQQQNGGKKSDLVKSLLETSQKEKDLTSNLLNSLISDVLSENKENVQNNNVQQKQKQQEKPANNENQNKENEIKENKTILAEKTEEQQQKNVVNIQNLQQIRTRQKPQDKINLAQFESETKIEDVLEVSQNNFNFGIVMPGNIFEESLQLCNKTEENMVVKVQVACLNQEFDAYDEYVYSVRKSTGFDYNEKYVVLLPPKKNMLFKVALKVPNIKTNGLITGSTTVQVQGLEDKLNCPIRCFVELPKITCNKSLFNSQNQCDIIKVAIRKGKKQDSRISFKSNYGGMLHVDFELLEPSEQESGSENYSLQLHPQSMTVQPENMFVVNLLLKNNSTIAQQAADQKIVLKRVLLMKMKNSSVILPFPIAVEIF